MVKNAKTVYLERTNLILENPNKSSNQIYKLFQENKIGMRKQDALRLIKSIKNSYAISNNNLKEITNTGNDIIPINDNSSLLNDIEEYENNNSIIDILPYHKEYKYVMTNNYVPYGKLYPLFKNILKGYRNVESYTYNYYLIIVFEYNGEFTTRVYGMIGLTELKYNLNAFISENLRGLLDSQYAIFNVEKQNYMNL